jgi:hypothetical protein
VGAFDDVHRDRISGSLAMFDRMIFKGYLTTLYAGDNARCFLWTQGVALKDFTPWAKATTERIANHARKLVTDAGRPVIVRSRQDPQPCPAQRRPGEADPTENPAHHANPSGKGSNAGSESDHAFERPRRQLAHPGRSALSMVEWVQESAQESDPTSTRYSIMK